LEAEIGTLKNANRRECFLRNCMELEIVWHEKVDPSEGNSLNSPIKNINNIMPTFNGGCHAVVGRRCFPEISWLLRL